jgi:hypothetical protein
MYIAYKQGSNLVLGNYLGTGPEVPTLLPNQSIISLPTLVSNDVPGWSKLSFSFCRGTGNKTIHSKTSFIYAWEDSSPVNGNLKFHTGGYGEFKADFVSQSPRSSAKFRSTSETYLLLGLGFIMLLI